MTSFAQRLSARNVQLYSAESAVQKDLTKLSMEADIYEAQEEVDANCGELQELAHELQQQVGEVDSTINSIGSLDSLVDETVAAYGENGVDEQGAELMQVSIEALLKAANINIPSHLIVPSFEGKSRAEYSAEAVEKKDSIVKKLLTWLKEAVIRMYTNLKTFWVKLMNSEESVRKLADKVKYRFTSTADTVSDPKAKVELGSNAKYLVDKNGSVQAPEHHMANCSARYSDFMSDWKSKFGSVDAVKLDKVFRIEFIVGHNIEVTPGPGTNGLLHARYSVIPPNSPHNSSAPVLTKDQISRGMVDTGLAFKELRDTNQEILRMGDDTSRLDRLVESVGKGGNSGSVSTKVRELTQSISKSLAIYTWGLTTTGPYYLRVIKASLAYLDGSLHHYPEK